MDCRLKVGRLAPYSAMVKDIYNVISTLSTRYTCYNNLYIITEQSKNSQYINSVCHDRSVPVFTAPLFSSCDIHTGKLRPKNSDIPRMNMFLGELSWTYWRFERPTAVTIPGMRKKYII